jgi:hypothetical protein
MTVVPFTAPVESPRDVLLEAQARDSRLVEQIAQALGRAHIEGYRGEPFGGLRGVEPAGWFRATAAFALRNCRRAWRTFAHRRAVDRAMVVVDDCMQHCFMERSTVDPFTWVRMDERKRRALLSILTKEIVSSYVSTLNGDRPIEPADYLELERQEALR